MGDPPHPPRHSIDESHVEDPWLFRAPKAPRGTHERPRRVDDRTQQFFPGPAPGLPVDRYAEERTTGVPLIPPGFAPRPAPIRSEGMPTVDRPRSPAPRGAAQVPRPQHAPTASPHAERPSRVVRAMDAAGKAVRAFGRFLTGFALGFALRLTALIFAAYAVVWMLGVDGEVDRLKQQNTQLRQDQAGLLKRLNEAETDVEQARSESGEAKEDADTLQRRVTQLEEQDQTSGS